MPITGAHVLLFSPEAAALRATLRDALGWDFVEAHPGWLIFALPPAELGVHPSDGDARHEDFGRWIRMTLPGGVDVPLYEPKHPLAIDL
jgi:hypothetical protein